MQFRQISKNKINTKQLRMYPAPALQEEDFPKWGEALPALHDSLYDRSRLDLVDNNHDFNINIHELVEYIIPHQRATLLSSLPKQRRDIVPYTPTQMKAIIENFKRKKTRHNFSKTIRYKVRQQFSQSRPRVGGRFIKIKRSLSIKNSAIQNKTPTILKKSSKHSKSHILLKITNP
jgi:hypothetical protein